MTPAETIIVALIYVASLLLGQRVCAFGFPDLQELGFLIAILVAGITASVLYYRREHKTANTMVVFPVGVTCGMLSLIVGMMAQLHWQTMMYPLIELPIIAVVTLLLPFALFPLGRQILTEDDSVATAIGKPHVIVAIVIAVVLSATAFVIPAPARSTVRLYPQSFPGLEVALPNWPESEKSVGGAYGGVRMTDPSGGDGFVSVRWIDSDPVQADDYVKQISAGTLTPRERVSGLVGGHEGTSFYLESDDHKQRAAATIWSCPQDHRVLWVMDSIGSSKELIMSSHQRIIESVHCHTERAHAAAEGTLPKFIPPPGFEKDNSSKSLVYIGPKHQTIVFDQAVPGRSLLVDADLSPSMLATMLQSIVALNKIEGTPTLRNVTDLAGHERRVWTAVGTNAAGKNVQVEVMVWFCDQRGMTFIGGYATEDKHDPSEGINALLPAVCHESK